jgi:hypothetical protein
MKYNQIEPTTIIRVGYRNTSALVLVTKPTRDTNWVCPTTRQIRSTIPIRVDPNTSRNIPVRVQISADTVVTSILTSWIINVKYDQIRPPLPSTSAAAPAPPWFSSPDQPGTSYRGGHTVLGRPLCAMMASIRPLPGKSIMIMPRRPCSPLSRMYGAHWLPL